MFRDDWERKAHDIICIIKFGGIGGSVRPAEIERVADILRGRSLPRVQIGPPAVGGIVRLKIPAVTVKSPEFVIPSLPNITIKMP